MKKQNKCVLLGMVCLFILVIGSKTAYATSLESSTLVIPPDESITNEIDEKNKNAFPSTSPWTKDSVDKSIYSNSIDTSGEEAEISAKNPGVVERSIAELIRNIATGLTNLLQVNMNASLDKIVYGRVGSGHPNGVNIYGFELRMGNPYGVTASVAYALIRGISYIFLAISFVFMLAKASWSGQTARSREEMKSNLSLMIYKFVLLALMPYFVDMALYIRDVVLYGIKELTGTMVTGGATLSLTKAFLMNAERSGTLVDAIMYLGTVVLTIYFVFIYITVAIDFLICFVAFPIVCLFQSKKRDLVNNWIMNVLSDILNPVIDAVLLLIPLLTGIMLSDTIKGVAVVKLVMCMLIIPTRGKVKSLLGIQSNDKYGFMGVMALMGLGRSLMGKVKKGLGKFGDIASDVQKSKMHGELAEVDQEEEESLLSGFGGSHGENRHGGDSEIDDVSGKEVRDSENRNDGMEMETNQPEADAQFLDGYETDSSDEEMDSLLEGSEIRATSMEEESEDGSNTAADFENAEQGSATSDTVTMNEQGEETQEEAGHEPTAKRSRNEIIRDLDDQIDKKQEYMDGLRSEKATLMHRDKALQRQMLDQKRGSEEYKKLERARADTAMNAAEVDKKIVDESQNINALKNQSKLLKSTGKVGGNNASALTSFEEKRAEILLKRANINNFEQPEFKNVLSNEQMQKLYRRRAYANVGRLAVETGGAVAGGTLAGGAAIFMQPTAVVSAAAGGALLGAEIGELGVNAGIASYRYGLPVVSKSLGGLSNAAATYSNPKTKNAAQNYNFEEPYTVPERGESIVQSVNAPKVEKAMHMQDVNMNLQTLQQQVQSDVSKAVQRVISSDGNIKNSVGLRAIQRANVEAEKVFASLKETTGSCPPEILREKRIEIQARLMSEEILKKLEANHDYERGSMQYKEAEKFIQEKVRKIMEDKNRSMF